MTMHVLSAKDRERADRHKGLSVNFACDDVLQALRTSPSPLLDVRSWTHRILPNGEGSVLNCASCATESSRGS